MNGDLAQTLYGTPTATSASPAPASSPAAPTAPHATAADVLYSRPAPVQVMPPAPATASAPAPAPATSTLQQAPAPAPAAAPAAQPVQSDADDAHPVDTAAIEALTPDAVRAAIPESIAQARAADSSRRLYGDQERDAIAASIPLDDMQGQGMTGDTAAAIRTELANMAMDAGATRADVDVLRSALADAHTTPLTDEGRMAARNACVAAFNSTFGQEAFKTLEITRTWIQQDPRRNAMFAQVGDNPQVALLAARLALAAQRRR